MTRFSRTLDRFQSTDESLQAVHKKLDRLMKANDLLERVGRIGKNSSKPREINNEMPDLLHVISHPNYYGSNYGRTTHVDFRGTSNTSKTEIIEYTVPSSRVALIRKLSIPYAATEFGTINFEIDMNGQNILGDEGIIEQTHWIEKHDILKSNQKCIVSATEQDTAQDFTAVLQILEMQSRNYEELKKEFEG